jgi:hypothetical protein
MRWFDNWQLKPLWRAEVLRLAESTYKAAKKLWSDSIPQKKSPQRDKTAYEASNTLSDDDDDDENELNRYPNSPRLKGIALVDPLRWWQDNETSYLVLSHLAFELLAAPSSTAASERLFSMAGNVVSEERPMTQ